MAPENALTPIDDAGLDQTTSDEAVADDQVEGSHRYRSARGPFEIFQAPPFLEFETDAPPAEREYPIDYSDVLENSDEDDVLAALGEMAQALEGGNKATQVYSQPGVPGGMSLGYAWFGPNFPLFRHSHPAGGDAIYYIIAGSLTMGSRVLKAGDGFFIPNGMPYKYRAGPEGVEVLEFRAGGGIPGAPAIKVAEPSADAIRRIAEDGRRHRHEWEGRTPTQIGDNPLAHS